MQFFLRGLVCARVGVLMSLAYKRAWGFSVGVGPVSTVVHRVKVGYGRREPVRQRYAQLRLFMEYNCDPLKDDREQDWTRDSLRNFESNC